LRECGPPGDVLGADVLIPLAQELARRPVSLRLWVTALCRDCRVDAGC
jgi:hypothetical protein